MIMSGNRVQNIKVVETMKCGTGSGKLMSTEHRWSYFVKQSRTLNTVILAKKSPKIT